MYTTGQSPYFISQEGSKLKPQGHAVSSSSQGSRGKTVYWTANLPGLALDWKELAGVWNSNSQVDLKHLKLRQSGPGSNVSAALVFHSSCNKKITVLWGFQEAVFVSLKGDLWANLVCLHSLVCSSLFNCELL